MYAFSSSVYVSSFCLLFYTSHFRVVECNRMKLSKMSSRTAIFANRLKFVIYLNHIAVITNFSVK